MILYRKDHQALTFENFILALESALDQCLSAQTIAENRCLAQQQRARAQAAAEDGHAWSRVEGLEHRVIVLSAQVCLYSCVS